MFSIPLRRALPALWLLGQAACTEGRFLPTAGTDTVYIAVTAARTATVEGYYRGVELAVADLNAGRDPASPPFGVRMEPEGRLSQVEIARFFRDDPTVVGVVGHAGSSATLDAAPIYSDLEGGGERGLVAISPTATNPRVARASEWVFRVCPTDDDAARALAAFAADSMGARRVAVIYENDVFGRGFTRVFAPELEARGTSLVERHPHMEGVSDVAAYGRRIAERGADALVLVGTSEHAPSLIRTLRASGVKARVLGTDDFAGVRFDAETPREFRGVRFPAYYDPERAVSPESRRFAEAYRARYGEAADHRAALSYDAALLIGRAVEAVGPDRRRVRDWIAEVGRSHPAVQGATGSIRFDEHGDPQQKPIVIREVES